MYGLIGFIQSGSGSLFFADAMVTGELIFVVLDFDFFLIGEGRWKLDPR